MAGQEMTFQLTYSTDDSKVTCKSCQGSLEDGSLAVGAKSEVMFDPMWYHFACFWDRCPYRKQMDRHVEDFTELPGYSKLTPDDRLKFTQALDEMTSGAVTAAASAGEAGRRGSMKRRSESDDLELRNLKSQKITADTMKTLNIPKLSMSATGRISPWSGSPIPPGMNELPMGDSLCVTVSNGEKGSIPVVSISDASEGHPKDQLHELSKRGASDVEASMTRVASSD